MQVNISARHGQLSGQTQERITTKVEKLRKFFDRVTSINVTADLEHRESPTVEIRVSAEETNDFVATDQGDLMVALDSALRKVEQQLRKHKEKLTGHRATGHKHLETTPTEEPAAE